MISDCGRQLRVALPDLTEHAVYTAKLVRDYPQLEDRRPALRLVEAVQSAFEGREPAPIIG